MIENAGGMSPGASPVFNGPNPFEALKHSVPNDANNQMPQNPLGNGGLNVDDLVKKIDAKIAELEKEEKEEEEKRKKEQAQKKALEEKKVNEEVQQAKEQKTDKELVEEKQKRNDSVGDIAPTMFTGFMDKIDKAMEHENHNITVHNSVAPEINGIPHKSSTTEMQKAGQVKDSEVSKYAVTDDQFFDDFFDE